MHFVTAAGLGGGDFTGCLFMPSAVTAAVTKADGCSDDGNEALSSPSGTIALMILIYAVVSALVSGNVPEPYMDEIFHVPQTQQVCPPNPASIFPASHLQPHK
eukprot:SAG11_NODE_383_length_9899_cov_10.535510_3_plen_103_part_00